MADEVTVEPDKRNQIKHDKLLRELNKIDQVERSDMRMLETARHRFRSKLKRFEVPRLSSGSDAMDVRMYDTHNPGFCYHCNGAIRACDTSPRKNFADIFHVVHSMLFTNGEVDPDKVLCLHVLAAHYAESGSTESSVMRPRNSLVERGKKENFSGAWNSVLPCYVLQIQRNVDEVTNLSDEMKRHKDPLVMEAEEEIAKDFECKYEKYLQENSDVGLALSANHKRTKMVPNGIGKITIIPPHVYSLLGAAQELKIKQAVAEESRRKRFKRSNSSMKNVDDQSISFRLDDNDDAISRRLMTATSIRGWNRSRIIGTSKVSAFRSLSRNSSHRTNPSITTLERASPRSINVPPLSEDIRTDSQIVTIKPSDRGLSCRVSKTSSTGSPFRNFSSVHGPGFSCSNSIMSGISGSLGGPRKTCTPIFINFPVNSLDLMNKEYKPVPILVNNQMQALVHSVLDVLERVNPSKLRRIVTTANSPYEIRRMLIRSDIQLFIDSLVEQPLISSPNSFVISTAAILDDIDPRVESSIEKELVATTLAVPPAPGLRRLVEEIRNNLFVDPEQGNGLKAEMKIETFGSQKQKLLEFKTSCKTSDEEKDVFDVDTSCLHSDIQGNKMTCACCYAKWKDSLSETERSKVPDYSFLIGHESELTPKNAAKYEKNTSEINSDCVEKKKRFLSPFVKDPKYQDPTDAVILQPAEVNSSKFPAPDPELETNLSVTTTERFHFSRNNQSKKGALSKTWKPIGLEKSKKSISRKPVQQPRSSLYISAKKSSKKTIKSEAKLSGVKISIDQINELRSYEGATSISNSTADSQTMISTSLQKQSSKITLKDDASSPKCQFKPWRASQNPGYLEPDRVILRRMTNPQRILVGQMCASLKTRRINLEGLVTEKTPLAALITPALSHETIKLLTKGTRQATSRKRETTVGADDRDTIISHKLTGPVLAKVRQAVAENETDRRLTSFLKSGIRNRESDQRNQSAYLV